MRGPGADTVQPALWKWAIDYPQVVTLLWILGASLVALACKEITWRHFGDIVIFLGVLAVGITLLVMVLTGGTEAEKIIGLAIFLGLIYASA